jgi:hypothetical protein
VRELRPGVWHWRSPHPDWDEQQWWPELVSSYGIEIGDDFLLFDPLCVPDELRERATAVILTAPYHERDARQLGLPVYTPPADTWLDWVEKFGVDPDRVRGMESDDLAWLRAGEGEGHFHGPGSWPFGISAYAGREDNDLVLWLPWINAIVTATHSRTSARGSTFSLVAASTSRVTMSSKGSARYSICRSRSCSPRTARQRIAQSLDSCCPHERRHSDTARSTSIAVCWVAPVSTRMQV